MFTGFERQGSGLPKNLPEASLEAPWRDVRKKRRTEPYSLCGGVEHRESYLTLDCCLVVRGIPLAGANRGPYGLNPTGGRLQGSVQGMSHLLSILPEPTENLPFPAHAGLTDEDAAGRTERLHFKAIALLQPAPPPSLSFWLDWLQIPVIPPRPDREIERHLLLQLSTVKAFSLHVHTSPPSARCFQSNLRCLGLSSVVIVAQRGDAQMNQSNSPCSVISFCLLKHDFVPPKFFHS